MKNDQCAERPRDPCHIYANPLHPEIYGILALGIYWSFRFYNQYERFSVTIRMERFRQILSRMVVLENVTLELECCAIDPQSLGTSDHSMQKGASTYGASGFTACMSIFS